MSALAEHVERVRLLLGSMNDWVPTPVDPIEPDSGPAASRYVPCETCRSRGEVRIRGGWTLCLGCDGEGWRRREAGERPWDRYLELPLDEAVSLPVTRPKAGRAQTSPEPEMFVWERVKATYDRHGSYRQMRGALDWLSLQHPRRYRLVRTVLVDHEPRALDEPARVDLDLGVLMIALRVRTVRVPPWLVERTAADERRDAILELAAIGLTAGEIARRTGIPRGTVRKRLR